METLVLHIQGTEVWLDGEGDELLLMLHGWPDTHRVWDGQVASLRHRFRCARFTWPGFSPKQPHQGHSLGQLMKLLTEITTQLSPQRPVSLMLHDWGCVFGHVWAARHPQRVRRIISLDIGDAGSGAHLASLSLPALMGMAAYQLSLCAIWRLAGWGALGRRWADAATRHVARWLACPEGPEPPHAGMNYPYDMQWTGSHGGLPDARRVGSFLPTCPMLFVYGERKPFMFHSAAWADELAQRPGCEIRGLPAGHWVMLEQGAALGELIETWLRRTTPAPTASPPLA